MAGRQVEATNQLNSLSRQPAEATCQMLRSRFGADVPLAILWSQQTQQKRSVTACDDVLQRPSETSESASTCGVSNMTSAHPAAVD